jgi:hypothetical protein
MKVIASSRYTGKTTQLIRMSAEGQGYIVTTCHDRACHIVRMAEEMELYIPFPLTFGEVRAREYFSKGVRGFLIDDAEALIQYFIQDVPIKAITVTTEEE